MVDEKREAELVAQAKRVIDGLTWQQVANAEGCEVWRGRQPGHGQHNAIDIIVTEVACAMLGDYDPFIFRVGSRYGLPFLGRDSVDSYYAEKMDNLHEKEREYCADKASRVLRDECQNWLEGNDMNATDDPAQAMRDFCERMREAGQQITAENLELLGEAEKIVDFMDELPRYEFSHQFYEDYTDSPLYGGDYPNVEVYSDSLVHRMHLCNQAAQAILAIKFPPEPQAQAVAA